MSAANEDIPDEMVAQASVPNAAALLRRAKSAGIIAPLQGYGPANWHPGNKAPSA